MREKASSAQVELHLETIARLRKRLGEIGLAIKASQFAIERELQRALGVTHEIGLGWQECPHSPTGKCFYDDDDDCAHDNCIMCGMPSERGKV